MPSQSQRVVLTPRRLAVVSSAAPERAHRPPIIALGAARQGDQAVYMAFGPRPRGEIEAAFLVFQATPAALTGTADVPVDVWRVTGSWEFPTLRYRARPPTAPPHVVGEARGALQSPLRLDVTALVRASAPDGPVDLVVTAPPTAGAGVSYALTSPLAPGPRLEIYRR